MRRSNQAVGKGKKLLMGILVGVTAVLTVVLAFLIYGRFQPYPPSGTVCRMNIRNFQTGARS
jgi:hypothetical protein